MHLLDTHDFAFAFVFNLHRRQAFLLIDNLVLHSVFLFNLKIHVSFLLVVLTADDLGLLSLLLLRQKDCFLNFPLFILSLLVQHIVLLGHIPLALILNLVVINFLLT